MKKRAICTIVLISISMSSVLYGCGQAVTQAQETERINCICPSCGYEWTQTADGILVQDASDVIERPSIEMESTTEEVGTEVLQTQESTQVQETQTEITTEVTTEEPKEDLVSQLSEGEKQARRELQANLVNARQQLYALPNSPEKVLRINELDKQILANNVYDFSGKTVQFIGDSITEGVTAITNSDGVKMTYVQYANKYLKIGTLLENGKAGRMFSMSGGEDYSLAATRENTIYNGADVYVFYLGVNDYLATPPTKRYGNVNDMLSTAGYCGAVRQIMKHMQMYFSDREVIFVTAYPLGRTVTATYTDTGLTIQPTLTDYMDVLENLAKEYGFDVINLYDDKFMDCTSADVSNFFLEDGVHPNNVGHQILGEHIAAELSLLLGNK